MLSKRSFLALVVVVPAVVRAAGAPCTTSNGTYAGKVCVYTIVRSPTVFCASETNSLGCTPQIAGVGAPSATSANPFAVNATSVLNQKCGLLIYGFKPRQTPFQGGSMCVVSPTLRTPTQNPSGSAPPASDCSGVSTLDFNAHPERGRSDVRHRRGGLRPVLVARSRRRQPTNLTDALAFFVNP